MMLPVIFIFTIGNVFGSPIANQYFDSLLKFALPNSVQSAGLDPAVLLNFTSEFKDKVKIIGKVTGKAEYFNGVLTELSHARRVDDCQGPYYTYGAKYVNCSIAFDNIGVSYDGKVKYGKMPQVSIVAKSDVEPTILFVEVNQIPPMHPYVKNFMFQQIGALKVEFTGLGPLNKYLKVLKDGFKERVQAEVFNSMIQYRYALDRAVAQFPLPM